MLEIKNLKKVFIKDDSLEEPNYVLKGVNLTINDDDFITVIGSNGCGKTTLLNCIAGTLEVNEGQIVLDGKDITSMSNHKRANFMARVFQDPNSGTISNMSLVQNLSLAEQRGKKKHYFRWSETAQKRERYKELLSSLGLGLEDRLDSQMNSFSGGRRQLVTLLMATLNTPKILLLDEPTAALDPKTSKLVLELTNKIVHDNHIPTLMITHNMKDAITYGNRLIMMAEGKIIFEASGEEKKKLTVESLVKKFQTLSETVLADSMILS